MPNQKKAYNNFMMEYHKLFSAKELRKLGKDEKSKLRWYHRLIMLQSTLELFRLKKVPANIAEWYKKTYRTEISFKSLNYQIEIATKKMNQFISEPQDEGKKISFDEIIVSVENVLNIPIDRSIKLYQFVVYYNNALKKVQNAEQNG